MTDVRVRYSPAPTGFLHIGSVHTALFNYLYARHHGGEFLLRVEDTDASRSRPEWAAGILDTLRWLGLAWDGEVVHQSSRTARYHEVVDRLLEQGDAYECFETPEELEAINETRRAAGLPPGYDGRARDLTAAQRNARRAEGRPRTIRFHVPDVGRTSFHDVIRGEVAVDWATISDFVIVRSSGDPVFYLANAVDDLDMGITHVIRGEDLLDSTHRVLAIRSALGAPDRPAYAHLSLILSRDRAKLSKRHGAVAVEEFRDAGYVPEALCNYLALLGWSPPDTEGEVAEVLALDQIVAAFDLDRVTHANAVFDHAKLDWLNGEWIRRLEPAELTRRVRPLLVARVGDRIDETLLAGTVRIGRERSTTLAALAEQAAFLFADEDGFAIDPEAWARLAATERVDEVLDAVVAHLGVCDWHAEAIDLRPVLERLGCQPRAVMPALYAAVEGRTAGLPLFDSIALLGRERALVRLRRARERLA